MCRMEPGRTSLGSIGSGLGLVVISYSAFSSKTSFKTFFNSQTQFSSRSHESLIRPLFPHRFDFGPKTRRNIMGLAARNVLQGFLQRSSIDFRQGRSDDDGRPAHPRTACDDAPALLNRSNLPSDRWRYE